MSMLQECIKNLTNVLKDVTEYNNKELSVEKFEESDIVESLILYSQNIGKITQSLNDIRNVKGWSLIEYDVSEEYDSVNTVNSIIIDIYDFLEKIRSSVVNTYNTSFQTIYTLKIQDTNNVIKKNVFDIMMNNLQTETFYKAKYNVSEVITQLHRLIEFLETHKDELERIIK